MATKHFVEIPDLPASPHQPTSLVNLVSHGLSQGIID